MCEYMTASDSQVSPIINIPCITHNIALSILGGSHSLDMIIEINYMQWLFRRYPNGLKHYKCNTYVSMNVKDKYYIIEILYTTLWAESPVLQASEEPLFGQRRYLHLCRQWHIRHQSVGPSNPIRHLLLSWISVKWLIFMDHIIISWTDTGNMWHQSPIRDLLWGFGGTNFTVVYVFICLDLDFDAV